MLGADGGALASLDTSCRAKKGPSGSWQRQLWLSRGRLPRLLSQNQHVKAVVRNCLNVQL